jgi:hypothetical protein
MAITSVLLVAQLAVVLAHLYKMYEYGYHVQLISSE